MQTATRLDQLKEKGLDRIIDEEKDNYLCFWKLFEASEKIKNYQCESCYGRDDQCYAYMPLCEMEEYIGRS
ncbi:MAG: hypothetical protein R6U32_01200 [Candidatus Woesearchaeota archaeon]